VTKNIQILRRNFEKYNIDGYIIPRNDDYFTEYCQKNRLKIISNFTGSAGIAVILKKKKLFIYRWKIRNSKSNRVRKKL